MLNQNILEDLRPRQKAYSIADKDGLFIYVNPSGSKIWRINAKIEGKSTHKTLGRWPDMSLDEARQTLAQVKLDLMNAAKAVLTPTFKECSQRWLELMQDSWGDKTRQAVCTRLDNYILPMLGRYLVTDISPQMVIAALRPIESAHKYETLRRCIYYTNQILNLAYNCGHIQNNPCMSLKAVFKRGTVSHMPSLDAGCLPEFFRLLLANQSATAPAKLLLIWSVCSLLRPSENCAMRWGWIEGDTMTIPAAFTKMRRPFRVPITPVMRRILEHQRLFVSAMFSPSEPHVWPSASSKTGHISTSTGEAVVRDLGYRGRLVPHGFRSMGRTWLAEQLINFEVAEACLSHFQNDKTVAAYLRADYLEQRRPVMERWSDFVWECYTEAGGFLDFYKGLV